MAQIQFIEPPNLQAALNVWINWMWIKSKLYSAHNSNYKETKRLQHISVPNDLFGMSSFYTQQLEL